MIHPVEQLLPELTYKEGWIFTVQQNSFTGDEMLLITVPTVDPKTKRGVLISHPKPIPPIDYPLDFWKRWLLEQIIEVERHEACEFFKLGDEYPFHPH